jgi:hypothetical protein
MLPLALSAAVLGTVFMQQTNDYETVLGNTDSYRDIDDMMLGKIREENYAYGNNWTSEQSRIVRPTIGRNDPYVSSKVWTEYHRRNNQALQDLYVKHQIADNQRILRPTIESKQRILSLPDASFEVAKYFPNAFVDYRTPTTEGQKFRSDTDYRRYDDKASEAGGINGEYIWNEPSYFGTPWGPGGQLFEHLRSKRPNNLTVRPGEKKHVRFAGTTVF